MGLYEFFFPHQAQAEYLKALVEQKRWQSVRARQEAGRGDGRIGDVEKDVGYLALVLGSILETLDRKGVLTRAEVKAEMELLDDVDGVRDGRLDVRVLRGKT
ncbi:MAG TPA: hypothetical protein VKF62_13430, partial [Planctomycetota bacterium]|nr:hypothetical protein [Planctomycetota bacterium]